MPSAEERNRVIVHVVDGEAFFADMVGLPGPTDSFIHFRNVMGRDNKPPAWLTRGARTVIFSAAHITFIEVFDDTEMEIFVRE
jgi:hypothetical protein